MTKFFRVLLVATYVGLTAFGPIQLLLFWGLLLSRQLVLGLLLGWALYCYVSAQALVEWQLVRAQVRKPLKEEEVRLNKHFDHVLQLAGVVRSFRFLILEESGYNAFATGRRTIVVSRNILEKMEPPQIEAILAHELGHHVSKDCLTGGMYVAANLPPLYLLAYCGLAKQLLLKGAAVTRKHFKIKRRFFLLILLVGLALLGIFHVLLPLVVTLLSVLAFRQVDRLFLFGWNIISRFTEYKQDAYVFQLGYGAALREVLMTMSQERTQDFSRYEILMRGSHPLLYNRIRCLEKLEGLR